MGRKKKANALARTYAARGTRGTFAGRRPPANKAMLAHFNYMKRAYATARAADPKAMLCYNEYGFEYRRLDHHAVRWMPFLSRFYGVTVMRLAEPKPRGAR